VELDRSRVTDIEERGGRGVVATVDGHSVAAGNGKLMDELGVKWQECRSVGTIVHMAVDGEYAGHIVISDVVKSDARDAIAALKRAGVQKTVMLTGDIQKVADHVEQDLGVDEVHAELLPGDKVARLERLLGEKGKDDCLAFVGDGINDAPVLSRADIGIAMGAMGSDAAIEAADVVLMDDDPMKIAKGSPDLAQVHPHRVREHRLLARREADVPAARRHRYRQHVDGHLRRRRRDGLSGSQCNQSAAHFKKLTKSVF